MCQRAHLHDDGDFLIIPLHLLRKVKERPDILSIGRLLHLGGFLLDRGAAFEAPRDIGGGQARLRPYLAPDFDLVVATDESQRARTSQIRTGDENGGHALRHDFAAEWNVNRQILVEERVREKQGRTNPVRQIFHRLFSVGGKRKTNKMKPMWK